MCGFILHIIIEYPVLLELISNGGYWLIPYEQWKLIHIVMVPSLTIFGAFGGFAEGVHWWRVIYIEDRFGKKGWKR